MKKFYLLFIAMMVSLAASATDYYLVGGFNNWALSDANAKFTANGDGSYTLKYTGDFNGAFLINIGNWNTKFGGVTGVKPGVDYTLYVNGGDMSMGEAVHNPTFTFNPTTRSFKVEAVTVELQYEYILSGQFAGKEWNDVALTEGADGSWSVAEAEVKGNGTFGKFQVRKNVMGTTTTIQYIKTDGDGQVKFGADKKYETVCKVGGANDFSINAGKYSFAFNPADMKLSITDLNTTIPTPDPTPEPTSTYELKGTVFGDGNWPNYPMTLKDGVWRICGNLTSGSFGIAEMENGQQKQWYNSAGDGNINAVGEYECKVKGTNFNSTLTGLYVISFDPDAMKLTVKEAKQFRYILWGQWNDKTWTGRDMNLDWDKFENKGLEYWYDEGVNVVGENGYAEFGIKKAEWYTGTQVQWISHDGSGTLAVGNDYLCKEKGSNFKIPAGQYTFVYDPAEKKLYVQEYNDTMTSVTDILGSDAPAEYYNLQGVRVDEPTSGVYIMRKGNKTVKVIK